MTTAKITNKKVLITGGAGFIGSNIADALLLQENDVICLDNLSTGHLRNIKGHFSNKNFLFIEGDIRDIKTCMSASEGADIILHQAALGSVPRSINDPITSNEVNLSGFLNILWAAKANHVKRVVYASSSSVYGDHPALPKREDVIGRPLSPYAITKHANELYAQVFSEVYGIETIGLRYFNIFGPKQDPEGIYAAVIPKFINLFLKEKAIIINGDGLHSRDFTYIDNAVQINQLAALTENKDAVNTVYNVGCGARISLNELVSAIKNNFQSLGLLTTAKVVHGPERKGDIKHSLASVEKAEKLLGYKPAVTFVKGIEKTIAWNLKNVYQ